MKTTQLNARDLFSWRLASIGFALMVLALIMAIPRGAGPDEHQHVARGAALVRGQVNGVSDWPMTSYVYLDVPWWVLTPDPGCYAFNPLQSASCAVVVQPDDGGSVRVLSQASSYPPPAHLLAGLATLLPGQAQTQWIARAFNALIPMLLVAWSVRRLSGNATSHLSIAALGVALTPGVLFFVSVVNPSGWTAAAAIAMWVALLNPEPTSGRNDSPLWVAGWCALVLARFDGVAFGVLLALFAVVWNPGTIFSDIASRLRLLVPVVAATLVNIGWSMHYGRREWLFGGRSLQLAVTVMLALCTVAVARNEKYRGYVSRAGNWASSKVWLLAVSAVIAPLIFFFLECWRRSLPYAAAVGGTGQSIREAVGVLGWVDTPIPDGAFIVWFITLGMVAGVALYVGSVVQTRYLLVLMVSIVTLQWFLQTSLAYWHGRYLFPVVVGVPLVAARMVSDSPEANRGSRRRFPVVVATGVAIVWFFGFAQMMRRFGISSVGVMNPAAWDTYGSVLPPAVLLAIFGIGASLWVFAVVVAGMDSDHFVVDPSSRTPVGTC